ncbi:MAG: SEC-C domain-containing protein [Proteobacteria bacterium]|nr:SEC-C domain-containing protein [Pseudomonadota bacterium]
MGPDWGHMRSQAMTETRKLNLRLPPDLYAQLVELASHECQSANAVMVAALRNWIEFRNRSRRGTTARPMPLATGQATNAPSSTARAGDAFPKVGPNQPCPCGSGQKYKRCHGRP